MDRTKTICLPPKWGRHNEYLSQVFTFPKSAKKQLVGKKMKIFLTQMIIYPKRNQR
jgi:hypothetical protein